MPKSKKQFKTKQSFEDKQEFRSKASRSKDADDSDYRDRRSNYRKQATKDSKTKRVNFDNESKTKFDKQYQKRSTDTKAASNEIRWYAKNPELVRAAGSLPFASVLGRNLPLGNVLSNGIPSIMTFWFAPTIGTHAINNSTAANQCFDSMYSFIVHANSRNYNYNASDLGIICLAGIEVFEAIAEAIRVYGVAKYYEEQNLYAPNGFIEALGFNAKDIRENLGTIWFQLNDLINRTRQIWIPNTLPLLERRFWMASNIFCDSPGVRSQAYCFVQKNHYIYNETGFTTGGALTQAYLRAQSETGVSTGTVKWNTFYTLISDMIDALISSEDRGIMFGDILKAYGSENLFSIPTISSEYTVQPVYNPEVLSQIENITVVTSTMAPLAFLQTTDHRIKQAYWSTNDTTVGQGDALCPMYPILNFHQASQPTPEQIMIATRLQAAGALKSSASTADMNCLQRGSTPTNDGTYKSAIMPYTLKGSGTIVYPAACGTEVVFQVTYITNTINSSGKYEYKILPFNNGTTWSSTEGMLVAEAFDWHPFIYKGLDLTGDLAASTTAPGLVYGKATNAYGDFDNYIVNDYIQLEKLHDVALFSLFGVPQM